MAYEDGRKDREETLIRITPARDPGRDCQEMQQDGPLLPDLAGRLIGRKTSIDNHIRRTVRKIIDLARGLQLLRSKMPLGSMHYGRGGAAS